MTRVKPNNDDAFIQNENETETLKSDSWISSDENSHDGRHDRAGLEDVDNDEPRTGKVNTSFIKKGSDRFVAAIRSLQCSPRVDKSDYCELKKREKASTKNYQNQQHQLPQQQLNSERPEFFADFDNFEVMQEYFHSVSKNLELEKVLEKLDNSDRYIMPIESADSNDLEIFTCDTDETVENDGRSQEHAVDKDDNDVECLRRFSGLKMDSVEMHNQDHCLTPTSTSKQIQTEFSQYSNDSNDTPVTCNKSIILTPRKQCLNHGQKDEQQSRNDNGIFCMPPKELLHRSLSLGDSLSPTEDDLPCEQDSSAQALEASYGEHYMSKNMFNEMSSDDCNNEEDCDGHHRSIHHSEKSIDVLKLPEMKGRRGLIDSSFAEVNVSRKVEQMERQEAVSTSFTEKNDFSPGAPNSACIDSRRGKGENVASNEKTIYSTPQGDTSPVSSTISSFVFSSDNGNDLEHKGNKVLNSEQTPCSFFRKTHPYPHPHPHPHPHRDRDRDRDRRLQQKSNHTVVKSEPISPAFFWKTHPRVTIKSYHFQQRQNTFRKVNPKLKNGRTMHWNA